MISNHLREALSVRFPDANFEPYFAFIESLPRIDKGHRHHILPRREFPEFARDANSLIRVSPADHFRAHYWLAVCAPNCESFQLVFYLMANRKRVYQISTDELTHYAEIYELGRIKQAKDAQKRGLRYKESGHIARLVAARHVKPDSEETRKRMGDAHRGEKNHNYHKNFSPEYRQKIGDGHRGLHAGSKNPMFGKKRLDLSQWNKAHPEQNMGSNNPMFGKKRPDLAQWNREHLKGKKRKPFSEEHKKKISKAKYKYWAARKAAVA